MICCNCDLWEPITQDTKKIFCFPKKKSQANDKNYSNDFPKVAICNSIPDALRDSHTSRYKKPRNKPNDGCLWKSAKRNNFRTSKQLRFVASTEAFNENQPLQAKF